MTYKIYNLLKIEMKIETIFCFDSLLKDKVIYKNHL